MSTGQISIEEALQRLSSRGSLTREEARGTLAALMEGKGTPAQIGAFLMGLRLKGETEDEVVGLVEAMRAGSVKVRPKREVVMDLCGTGGDGSGTFNISTAASFVVAGAGVAVAKHGNRSASSRCGSADVLEALGIPIDLPPERVQASIDEHGFGFLFAPLYHPAMKHVAGVRREIRIRTIFNLLGPLTNPAGVTRQLMGVFDGGALQMVARVLRSLGSRHVWVVHGDERLDELSVGGTSTVTVLWCGEIREMTVRPGDCALPTSDIGALRGGEASENARIVMEVLSGERGPRRDAVLLNAAAALVVAEKARDLKEGGQMAAEAVDSQAALRVLEAVRSFR